MEQNQPKPIPSIEKSVNDIKWELKRLTEQVTKVADAFLASKGIKPTQPVAPPQYHNGGNQQRGQYNGDYRSNDAPF